MTASRRHSRTDSLRSGRRRSPAGLAISDHRRIAGLVLLVGSLIVLSSGAAEAGAQTPPPTTVPPDAGTTPAKPDPEPTECDALPSFASDADPLTFSTTPTQNEQVKARLTSGESNDEVARTGGEQVTVDTDAEGLKLASRSDGRSLQIVGSTTTVGREITVSFRHPDLCGTAPTVTVSPDGRSGTLTSARSNPLTIAAPWAIDATGRSLPTRYQAQGNVLVQVIDTTAAVSPVVFDPTYSSLNCSGHWSDLTAYWYLNINANDTSYCPISGMLLATRGYTAMLAHETNVANDVGLVAVRVGGGCSWSPDTGPSWDFQIPCKAHDYCYDLRAAGFSGTVSDADCDNLFYLLMEAHCNNRVLAAQCRTVRDAYYLATAAPGVVTDPDPGIINIRNRADDQCVDVEGPSTADFAPLQQWGCVSVANQKFRIFPGSTPGLFEIRIPFSGNKCAASLFGVAQRTCSAVDAQYRQVRIQGALGQDQYSIRPQFNLNSCWKVPFVTTFGQNLDNTQPCDDYNYWYIWRINAII